MSPPDDALAGFVGKWWQREPEMRIAANFCPAPARDVFDAWGALGHELHESAFERSDARVAEGKCGWWAEELIGWGERRHRHPLGRVLSQRDAPWAGLGRAWLAIAEAPDPAADAAGALAALDAPARALAAVEAALFGHAPDAAQARAIAVHALAQRLPHGLAAGDRARVPMHLVARHGAAAFAAPGPAQAALLRDWAAELLAALPSPAPGSAFRRSRTAFDRARLAALARTGQATEPAGLATLWRAWRAARDPGT
jgi:hypothetical protein